MGHGTRSVPPSRNKNSECCLGVPGLCVLSYRSIAARVCRDPKTVSRTLNRWFQEGNTECRAGSQQSRLTSSREDRHVTRMALMDRADSLQALSQELVFFARKQASARTARRRLQQHGLSA
ncbi:HTH_Tnp_Tc3_2 domain-containing protein [Trichonephila clavipes]|nr:HTH_Tnp_Tc3_2 domain-containing protein [Trichonephila clavipes]